jgi:small subunit ribosomal protein S21
MIIVNAEGKKIEYVLKEFKRKVDKTKTLKNYRSKMEYEKPSVKRRKVKKKAIRKHKYIRDNENQNL